MKTARTQSMLLVSGGVLLLGVALHLLASGVEAAAQTCRKDFFPASGQTQPFAADLNDGIAGQVPVPDDGAIQAGKPLSYQDNGNGTITDLNTGLIWEKKSDDGGLHDQENSYVWSGTGSQETIWDWLKDVNSEAGGIGFAGRKDWRIPNVRELQSIIDYGTSSPAVDSAFDNNCSPNCTVLTCSCTVAGAGPGDYWSSTTFAVSGFPGFALIVDFNGGGVLAFQKSNLKRVRAVRAGCVP